MDIGDIFRVIAYFQEQNKQKSQPIWDYMNQMGEESAAQRFGEQPTLAAMKTMKYPQPNIKPEMQVPSQLTKEINPLMNSMMATFGGISPEALEKPMTQQRRVEWRSPTISQLPNIAASQIPLRDYITAMRKKLDLEPSSEAIETTKRHTEDLKTKEITRYYQNPEDNIVHEYKVDYQGQPITNSFRPLWQPPAKEEELTRYETNPETGLVSEYKTTKAGVELPNSRRPLWKPEDVKGETQYRQKGNVWYEYKMKENKEVAGSERPLFKPEEAKPKEPTTPIQLAGMASKIRDDARAVTVQKVQPYIQGMEMGPNGQPTIRWKDPIKGPEMYEKVYTQEYNKMVDQHKELKVYLPYIKEPVVNPASSQPPKEGKNLWQMLLGLKGRGSQEAPTQPTSQPSPSNQPTNKASSISKSDYTMQLNQARAAIKSGVNKTSVKKMFKEKTGKEYPE